MLLQTAILSFHFANISGIIYCVYFYVCSFQHYISEIHPYFHCTILYEHAIIYIYILLIFERPVNYFQFSAFMNSASMTILAFGFGVLHIFCIYLVLGLLGRRYTYIQL